jgi:hypothetical protein
VAGHYCYIHELGVDSMARIAYFSVLMGVVDSAFVCDKHHQMVAFFFN